MLILILLEAWTESPLVVMFFKLHGNTISWKSKKQNIVTLSTTEAELVALCESCVESCWLIKLVKDVDVNLKHVTIF